MFLNDNVRDNGLSWLTSNATRLIVCRQEPATYAEAIQYALGSAPVIVSVPEDRPGGGRRVQVSEIVQANVGTTGTGTHFALTNGSSILCAVGPMASPVAVTAGETFDTTALYINIPDEVV